MTKIAKRTCNMCFHWSATPTKDWQNRGVCSAPVPISAGDPDDVPAAGAFWDASKCPSFHPKADAKLQGVDVEPVDTRKTMTREMHDWLRKSADWARKIGFHKEADTLFELLSCVTPIEDQKENPDSTLVRELGYEPGASINQEYHHYCPQCGPFAIIQEDGTCISCGSTTRDVNPRKE